jgi:MFS family permease
MIAGELNIMTRIDRIVWDTLSRPRRWLERWYVVYALLGAVTSGLIPILLPLMMVSVSHNQLATVGYVMGAFNLGAMSSPFWGRLADAEKIYRSICLSGLVLTILSMSLFPFAQGLLEWFVLALGIGAGSAAVTTCVTLLIVEFHPKNEWTPRIGWLQTFNGAGQMLGLLLAGVFAAGYFDIGLWTGAGILAAGVVIGMVSLPRNGREQAPVKPPPPLGEHRGLGLDFLALARFDHVELLGVGLLRHFHVLNLVGILNAFKLLPTRFGRFLVSWFCIFVGVAGFFASFPLFLQDSFSIPPSATSLTYGIACGIGLFLYTFCGRWAERFGAGRIYFSGRMARLLGFTLMLVIFLIPHTLLSAPLALLSFAIVVLSWPVISVTGTELTSELSPLSQGAAQGLNNAANGIGTVAGTYLAGGLIHWAGYVSIPLAAVGGMIISILADTSFQHHQKKITQKDEGKIAS